MPGLCARVQGDEHSGDLAPTLDWEEGDKLQRAAVGGGGAGSGSDCCGRELAREEATAPRAVLFPKYARSGPPANS